MKKLILSLVPLLAMAAFMMAPSIASAGTEYGVCVVMSGGGAPCPATEKFTPFVVQTNVVSEKAPGSGNFILKTETGKTIECATFSDKGVYKNNAGFGESKDTLVFDDCVPVAELGIGCKEINKSTNHEIFGEVTDIVQSETKVTITVAPSLQFDIRCNIAGVETDLKGVTGVVKGTAKAKTDELAFTAATGLEFNHEDATITGTNATKTEVGAKPVLIH